MFDALVFELMEKYSYVFNMKFNEIRYIKEDSIKFEDNTIYEKRYGRHGNRTKVSGIQSLDHGCGQGAGGRGQVTLLNRNVLDFSYTSERS